MGQTSITRLFRQLMYVPMFHSRWLTNSVKQALGDAITQAEIGHSGEICVIIENHLPIGSAYHQTCRDRAIELFAEHHVWDTEHNTGVLIYVNLCEHDLQIVADRGIDQRVADGTWQSLCAQTLERFRQQQMAQGICELILATGELLRTHQPSDDVMGNELPNCVKYLT